MRVPLANGIDDSPPLRADAPPSRNNLSRAVSHAPEIASAQRKLMDAVCAELEPRLRELVVLRQAVVLGNEYCWSHHVGIALRIGISSLEIQAVRAGELGGFVEYERCLLEFTDAVANRSLTDELWAVVADCHTPRRMVALTMLIGAYAMLATVRDALDVPLDEGLGGWTSPE